MGEASTILIVEDSTIQRVMLKRLLEQAGYAVLLAEDGVEGLQRTRDHHPHLIISDIAMPNMDGYEMCREIKRDETLKTIPVIILTGLDDPREVIRGLNAQADNYLTKPLDEKLLLDRIDSLINAKADEVDAGTRDGLKIAFAGESHVINASRRQTMNLLLSTYENAVRKNRELIRTQLELKLLNEHLEEEVRKRTRELEIANRAKTEFIANMSHELRTPMNAIIGMTDLVLHSDIPEHQKEMLSISRQASDNLLVLLNSLLDFSRLGTGTLEAQSRGFKLRAQLKRLLSTSLEKVREKGLSCQCQVAAEVPDGLVGDFLRTGQILAQLMSNAIKFTEAGSVTVSVRRESSDGSSVTLEYAVTDTGIGIAPEDADKVFDSFTQADGSATRQFGGAGLGLSLAKGLAELLGGGIRFESTPGTGSVFICGSVIKSMKPWKRPNRWRTGGPSSSIPPAATTASTTGIHRTRDRCPDRRSWRRWNNSWACSSWPWKKAVGKPWKNRCNGCRPGPKPSTVLNWAARFCGWPWPRAITTWRGSIPAWRWCRR